MSGFWIFVGVCILCVDLWAINSVARSDLPSGTRLGWALLILLLPVVGLVIWGVAGPRGLGAEPTSKSHSKG